jgi:plastocyanin
VKTTTKSSTSRCGAGSRRGRGLPAFALGGCLLLLPALALAGTIRGQVLIAGAAPAPKKVDVTIDQYLCGNEKDANDLIVSPKREIANAVVWIENPPPGAAWPAGAAESRKVALDQKGCVFEPRVVIVPVGGTVEFLNSDRLLHNIHATPKLNASFNRTQPKDRTIPITFSKAEIVHIECDLHSWMTAWVAVAAHPYYAITAADGKFAFENLPAGTYRLKVWQERLGTVPAEAVVKETGEATVAVEMPVR